MPDPSVGQFRTSADELALRLADVAAILSKAETDEDSGVLWHGDALLSALDYALRGDGGCIEPDEWGANRRAALAEHGEYLGL